MTGFNHWLDLLGVAVFAASGALVASRKEMDIVGFALVGTLTGIGGGTLRDLLLGHRPLWIAEPVYVLVCLAVAGVLFFAAPFIQRRYPVLLWADAAVAMDAGAAWPVAVIMGVMTATFGGLLRDTVCNEIPLILRKEIYACAAALGAAVFVGMRSVDLPPPAPGVGGFVACFVLRAFAIGFQLSLPAYRPRPGRDYPPE